MPRHLPTVMYVCLGWLHSHNSRWHWRRLHQMSGTYVRRRFSLVGPRPSWPRHQPHWQPAGTKWQLLQVWRLAHAYIGRDGQWTERAGVVCCCFALYSVASDGWHVTHICPGTLLFCSRILLSSLVQVCPYRLGWCTTEQLHEAFNKVTRSL